MLNQDVQLRGWTAEDWARIISVFRPLPRAQSENQAYLVAVHDGERLRKLLHSKLGRVPVASHPWPLELSELAERHGVARAVSLHMGALEELMERFGARAQPDDDILTQSLTMVQALKELVLEEAVGIFPPGLLRHLPLPPDGVAASALESLSPNGKVLLVGVFHEGELWTSVALRREGKGIDLLMGPEGLRADMGLISGDFRRDYRYLAEAVEAKAGPLAAGLYLERDRLVELLHTAGAGAWAGAVATRDVVLSPVTPGLAVPLGVDATRGVVLGLSGLFQRLAPVDVVPQSAQLLAGLVEEFTTGAGGESGDQGQGERTPLQAVMELLRKLGEIQDVGE